VQWDIVDPDNTTGITGIKFDIGIPKGETLTVWFTLEGLWDNNDITVWIKAGQQDPYEGPDYTVTEPACFIIPEPATIAALATSLLALAAYATHKKNRITPTNNNAVFHFFARALKQKHKNQTILVLNYEGSIMNFPLSFWDLSLWLAVTAIILLITSELISPYYGRTNILINKKRLRNAALTMGVLFLITVAIRIYGIITSA